MDQEEGEEQGVVVLLLLQEKQEVARKSKKNIHQMIKRFQIIRFWLILLKIVIY